MTVSLRISKPRNKASILSSFYYSLMKLSFICVGEFDIPRINLNKTILKNIVALNLFSRVQVEKQLNLS